jgi:hypothetical protein
VAGQLRDQRHRAVHPAHDHLVDPLQVLADQRHQRRQRRAARPLASFLEIDDDCHLIVPDCPRAAKTAA